MNILLNGEQLQIAEGTTVASLLARLERNSKFLAVERNRELVPRSEHASCRLDEGDEIEIVTLVGGG